MIYPGTSPAGFQGMFGQRGNPQDLEQRKQALVQQLAASGGSAPGTLSFGGSTGDAAARQPGIGWNPFLSAQQEQFGVNNAGQQGNMAVNAQPFFGGGVAQTAQTTQNIPGNGPQAAQASVGPTLGVATQQQQAPPTTGGVTNPAYSNQLAPGASRLDFGSESFNNPFGTNAGTIQNIISRLGQFGFQAPTGGLVASPLRYM